jgi:ATP-dependent exoDNAse (exonuclease V) alpha subunit
VQALLAESAALLEESRKLATQSGAVSARMHELHTQSDQLIQKMAALDRNDRTRRANSPPDLP